MNIPISSNAGGTEEAEGEFSDDSRHSSKGESEGS